MFLDDYATSMIAVIGFFFFILLIIFILLWVILPFSIFGMKGLVREVIEEQQKTNKLLKTLLQKDPTTSMKETGETESEERG
jgi:hypothetical protein